jgi:two-component system NtrC family sensor kinase
MEAFVWGEQFMTGEALVDGEHQELVRTINQVIDRQSQNNSEEDTQSLLDKLVKYAAMHFAHEEALMASSGCDPRFIEAHRAIHRDFAQQVGRMSEFPSAGRGVDHLLRFLTSWLAQHILGIDQSMARQIRRIRTGVSAEAAYLDEQQLKVDPATASLIEAMNALYGVIAARNDSLFELNRGLERQVAARTQALSLANEQLTHDRESLKVAIGRVQVTQKKLLESEHKRAEATKRNMEQYLAQIVDGDPVPTFVIDANHRITHWNKACALISGLDASAMVGTDQHWKPFYSDARPTMSDLIVDGSLEAQFETYYKDIFRRSATIPDAFEAESFFPGIGREGAWLFFTAAPLHNAEGQVIGAIETLQDVTERKLAQDKLLAYQNELEQKVSQRTSELAEANTRLGQEHTALKEMLHKYEGAQQQLLQSEKLAAIGQLAAGVAHEINNPIGFVNSNLGTLKTYISNLLDVVSAYEGVSKGADAAVLAAAIKNADLDFLREDLPSLLAESQAGLGRVTKIVQDLKDFSRVDQTGRQLSNLNAAMESTLNVASNEIKYKANVVRELGEIPEVNCDPAQINQVFMNLLVNAAHAIEQRGTIFVRSGVAGDGVWFEVEDTGKGMPEAVMNRIFEPFFTTKAVGKGTGLGLSISYDIIVKRHGGKLEVTSDEGKGTRFRIWLPQSSTVEAGDA